MNTHAPSTQSQRHVPLHGCGVVVVLVVVSVPHRVGTSWQSSVPSNGGRSHGHDDGQGFDKKYHAEAVVDQRDTQRCWQGVVVDVDVVVLLV